MLPLAESKLRYPYMAPLSVELTLRLAFSVYDDKALKPDICRGFSTNFRLPWVRSSS
jgi:hypothetical protein